MIRCILHISPVEIKGGRVCYDGKKTEFQPKLYFINNIFAVAKMIWQKFAPIALISMTFKKFCGIDVQLAIVFVS
jgi:hypothetical protein